MQNAPKSHETCPAPVLCHGDDAAFNGIVDGANLPFRAVYQNLPGLVSVQPGNGPGDLCPACADHTGDSNDFALSRIEADVPDLVIQLQIPNLQAHVSDRHGLLRICLRQLAANHHADDAGRIELLRRARFDHFAVPDDRDIVAQLKHLFHAVRDVDDGDAPVAQLVDFSEQPVGLVVRQGGRRLVHNDDLRVERDHLHNFQHLNIRHGKLPDLFIEVAVNALRGQIFFRALADFLPVYKQAALSNGRMPANKKVFRNRQIRDILEFLIYHGNSTGFRFRRAVEHLSFPVHIDLAGSRLIHAIDNFHQRGLSRAIFSYQRMDDALANIQRYIFQRRHAREGFHNIFQL